MDRSALLLLLAGCSPEVTAYSSAFCEATGLAIASPYNGAVLDERTDSRAFAGHQMDVVVVSELESGAEVSPSLLTAGGVLMPWPARARGTGPPILSPPPGEQRRRRSRAVGVRGPGRCHDTELTRSLRDPLGHRPRRGDPPALARGGG